ncbi:MAG: DNA polymerase III subunit gamma/tau [Defluviitaleaceae bacterium]|nr:DNA polymerase III subunit gamma/tau [Defluviitaleaceae bacterium]
MHTALYRKRRPKSFADLVGQPHVVQALSNQLQTGQVSHAYLFCGTRGTGKTSAAKIFARAVNCQAGDANNANGPCNICDICQSILSDRCMDVIEIDAASNNSVDNIRDLREEVRYPTTQGIYKVYIIDEVHMLSTSAFNALLKTLEEPPPHVIFILATTDPQKIPATILSRCQRYDFKRISASDMIETMKRYLQAENATYEDAALERIAYHSDGAMRDALSLLDQCLNLGSVTSDENAEQHGTTLTLGNVLKILGAVDRQALFDFTEALAAYDSTTILKIIDDNMKQGRDVAQLTNDLIRHFRDVLVAGQGASLDYSAEITQKLKEQGTHIQPERLIVYIHTFSETLRELRFAPHMRTALEVCALRQCSPAALAVSDIAGQGQAYSSSGELEGLISRIAKLERQISDTAVTPQTTYTGPEQKPPQVQPIQETQPAQPKNPQSTQTPTPPHTGDLTPQLMYTIQSNWISVVSTLSPMLRSTLIRCGIEPDGAILKIICDNESEVKFLKDKNRPLMIREALAEKFNLSTPPNLAFIVSDPYNVAAKPKKLATSTAPPQPPAREAPKEVPFEIPLEIPSEVQQEAVSQAQPETAPVEMEQLDWSSFGQDIDTDTTSPF